MNNNPVNKIERKILLVLAIVVVIGALFLSLVNFIANFLWFKEMGYLDKYIDRGYRLFRQRVSDGRHLPVDSVEKIAQGHVWLGQDALKNKLVDELGGLDVAVSKAAKLANLPEYYTRSYPAQRDWLEQLLDGSVGGSYIDGHLREMLGEYYSVFTTLRDIQHRSAIQARLPYDINIH